MTRNRDTDRIKARPSELQQEVNYWTDHCRRTNSFKFSGNIHTFYVLFIELRNLYNCDNAHDQFLFNNDEILIDGNSFSFKRK